MTVVRADKDKVKNHQLKLMALSDSGVACPPCGGYFHLPVETGSIEIGRIKGVYQ